MKILGSIKINNSEKVLRVKKVKENYIYYLDGEEIGGYNPNVIEDKILFKQNTKENEMSAEIKDKIENLLKDTPKENIQNTQEDYSQERVLGIEKILALGNREKIKRIVELDLEQEKEEKKSSQVQQPNTSFKENDKKYSNIKDINIKQEMNFYDKATDMKTLGHIIEKAGKMPKVDGKKFVKMGIVESDKLDNITNSKGEKSYRNTTRYSVVAIATDGTVVNMDLEQDYQEGNNPRETNYQVRQDGRVEKDDVLSRFKIGEGTFSIKNGKYGELKVYHSPRKTLGGDGIEGNKSLDRELETNNVWEMKTEERQLASEYGDGYRSVEEGYEEVKKVEKDNKDCDKIRIEDIDGDENTKGHNHNEEFVQKLADELMKIDVIDEVFTRREVEQVIRKEKNTQNLTNKQIAEKIKNELEYDAEMISRQK